MTEQDAVTKNKTEEQKFSLCVRILQNIRNRLYGQYPYLDGAFAGIGCRYAAGWEAMSTDGDEIFFSSDYLLKLYQKAPQAAARGYLHMLLHCLYLHCFPDRKINRNLWDLACDISAELMIENDQPGGYENKDDPERKRFIQKFAGRTPGANQIYRMLEEGSIQEKADKLQSWFSFDDHRIWYREANDAKKKQTRQKWEKILAYTGARHQDHQKKRGENRGNEEETVDAIRKSRYDYRKFLKKFAIPREEMEIDQESFDYIFYNLGMETYGNMPLIEPLEYKEVYKLEELVIAIDTSGSCDREMVQNFLSETYRMLSDKENFFHKMKVYLIQCDCCIQEVLVIHSEEEWKNACMNFKIQGRGGTDFRPVFEYVEKLRRKKELKNLKALIYFTDGDGIYPREKTDYETAFVFVNRTDKMDYVPEWACKLIV